MSKKQYSESDVERLLADAARPDRRRMDDATTERFLALIREETGRHVRARSYTRAARWAVALVVLGVGVSQICPPFLPDADKVASMPAECPMPMPIMGLGVATAPYEAANGTTGDAANEPACRVANEITNESARRAYLGHLDNTMEAGFAPSPQETYQGRSQHRYGAGVYGNYEYKACTDTL